MLTLGIETSTRQGSIALSRDGEMLCERSLGPVSQRHATTLFVEIERAFKDHNLNPTDIGQIGVSIGPGSFTGLRIGIVAAKTLAYALSCPVKAIDSFLVVAQRAPEALSELTVIGDAQRGDLFAGRYSRASGEWRQTKPIKIVPIESFVNTLSEDDVVTGTGVSRCEGQLTQRALILEKELHHPSAGAVCQLAERSSIADIDPFQLTPVYLRKSSAEEKWEKNQGAT